MVTPHRGMHHLDVFSMPRAKRVASRDAGQLIRAIASLLGLAVAIAMAVGLGSMMGGSDRRIPLAQEPATSPDSSDGASGGSRADDVFDGIFGGSTSEGAADDGASNGSNGTEQPSTNNPGDSDDVDLPDDDDLIGPIEVPVTPIPDVDIDEVIDDLTGGAPDENLLTGLLDDVDGIVGDLGETVGGLLGN